MEIQFNNLNSKDLELEIIKKPFIPIPRKIVETKDINGKDGSYYIDKNTYEDIIVSIDFNFYATDHEDLELRVIRIQKWLNSINDNKLIINNSMFYYIVKNINISNIEYDGIYEINKFTVEFVCEAYKYLRSNNKQTIQNNTIINNMYSLSKPVYYIAGNGSLNVNGNIVTISNNTDGIVIDTVIGKVLSNTNTVITGKTNINSMQDLYLKSGINKIIHSGIQLQIKKNYRTI